MDECILDWAAVVCSKASTVGSKKTRLENRYMIALDVSVYNQSFYCPCCGAQMSVQVSRKDWLLSDEQKKEAVRGIRKDSWERLKTFAGVCLFLIAAIAAGLLTDGAAATALTWIVMLVFALIWLPGFVLMIKAAFLLRDEARIIKSYEKKLPSTEITLVSARQSEAEHYFEYVPEFVEDDSILNYGME